MIGKCKECEAVNEFKMEFDEPYFCPDCRSVDTIEFEDEGSDLRKLVS